MAISKFSAALALIIVFTACQAKAETAQRSVTIDAGEVTLAATLHMPETCPQEGCSAVVLGHGSAPTTRENLGFYRNIALSLGFAVLAYDKRGNGESTGVYEPFNVADSDRVFRELAADMMAVTEWLVQQDGINPADVGLFGGSQAGWIMPLSVHLGGPASFIIVGEGAAISAGRETAHGQVFQELRGSEGSEDITFHDRYLADAAAERYSGDEGYDPAPVLEELTTPTLWLFGLSDDVIPVMLSIRQLGSYIASGRDNHSIHIFPYGDHNFTNRSNGGRYDLERVIRRWREQ